MNITIASTSSIPTPFGKFQISVFENDIDNKEHVALIYGDIEKTDDILVRIHSECLTGDVFGSMRCDCHSQLWVAMETIAKHGAGILLYLRQEGRGIGLANKIKAYALQDEGMDTFEANKALGFEEDERIFDIAGEILKKIGVSSLKILTNNPDKIASVERSGIQVTERIPLISDSNEHNEGYMEVKKRKGGHML